MYGIRSKNILVESENNSPITQVKLPERFFKAGQYIPSLFVVTGKWIYYDEKRIGFNLGLKATYDLFNVLPTDVLPTKPPPSTKKPLQPTSIKPKTVEGREKRIESKNRKKKKMDSDGFKLLKDATQEEQRFLPAGVKRKLVHFGHVVWVKFNPLANHNNPPPFHLVAFDPGVKDLAYATDTYGNSYR